MITQFPKTPQRHSVFKPILKHSGCDWNGVGRLHIAAAAASRIPATSLCWIKYRKSKTQYQPTPTLKSRNSPVKIHISEIGKRSYNIDLK